MSKKTSSGFKVILPQEHGIHVQSLDEGLLSILAGLQDHGYKSYVVGGCIRDLLAGVEPKDFDVVTNARPEQIRKIFPKSIIVGRRFALVHVRIGWNRIIEVATFRGKHADRVLRGKFGRWLSKWWTYGSIETDVWRRDATINALYLSYKTGEIYDYVGGYDDLKRKQVRMIGDTNLRFEEDPVRVLRIIRLKAKLSYEIDDETNSAIKSCAALLQGVSPSRLYGEIIRTFHGGFGTSSFDLLKEYKMLTVLFPRVSMSEVSQQFIRHCLFNADKRVANGLPVSASFLFAVFLWTSLEVEMQKSFKGSKKHQFDVRSKALLQRQHKITALPKRVWFSIVNIWRLQHLFIVLNHRSAERLSGHQMFRSAFDFFQLRSEFDTSIQPWVEWWHQYLAMEPEDRKEKPILEQQTIDEQ